ncbi:MAG: ABC transporter permease [Xanthomonadaceae bacterium]|nr:ABC transporter permease [Xanthomonadaceae bacterium]
MDIRPILSTLLRHKTAAALIVLEIALSCAIICNALFLITDRIGRIGRDSGLTENELVRLQIGSLDDGDETARARADMAALRAIPGVVHASSVNQIPYGGSSWNSGVRLTREQQDSNFNASTYLGDEQMLETFGLRLIAGRDFADDEYLEWEAMNKPGVNIAFPAAIVTRAFAENLYPGQNAIGKSFLVWGDNPTRIVGIVDHVLRPNDAGASNESGYSVFLPVQMSTGLYVLRTAPERRADVMKTAIDTLNKLDANRLINDQDLVSDMRRDFYGRDRAVAWLLAIVCAALLTITAFGIGGLVSFWVQQRTKQIGVRRALGATRGQILRYFQIENFLLATIGIALGMLGAYGLNQLLMSHYELPRLPLVYLPVGAAALWLLGQVAVFGPARRAAAVPPAIATRSV